MYPWHRTFRAFYQAGPAEYDVFGRLLNPHETYTFCATFTALRLVDATLVAVRQANTNRWEYFGTEATEPMGDAYDRFVRHTQSPPR